MNVMLNVQNKTDFPFKGIAKTLVNYMSNNEFQTVLTELEDLYGNGFDGEEFNNLFCNKADEIVQLLNYDNYKQFILLKMEAENI